MLRNKLQLYRAWGDVDLVLPVEKQTENTEVVRDLEREINRVGLEEVIHLALGQVGRPHCRLTEKTEKEGTADLIQDHRHVNIDVTDLVRDANTGHGQDLQGEMTGRVRNLPGQPTIRKEIPDQSHIHQDDIIETAVITETGPDPIHVTMRDHQQ